MAVGRVLVDSRAARGKRSFRWERVAWGSLFVVAVLAVLAAVFTSKGPEPPRAAGGNEARLRIESEHDAHFRQPTTIRVHVGGGVSKGLVRIWVPADYLQKVEVQDINPKPAAIDAAPDRLVYVFWLPDPSRPATFSFTFLPAEVGPLSGRMGLVSGEEQSFEQFVDP